LDCERGRQITGNMVASCDYTTLFSCIVPQNCAGNLALTINIITALSLK